MKLIKSKTAVIFVVGLLSISVSARAIDYVHTDTAVGTEPSASPTTLNVIRFSLVRAGQGITTGGGGGGGRPRPYPSPCGKNQSPFSQLLTLQYNSSGSEDSGLSPGTPCSPFYIGGRSPSSLSNSISNSPSTNSTSSSCTEAGDMGLLYLKQTGTPTAPIDTLSTCIARGPNPSWTGCTQGTVYSRTTTSSDPAILGADMAIATNGLAAVAWTEVSGVSTATVTYKIAFTADYGASWSAPSIIGQYNSVGGYAVPNDIDIAATYGPQVGTRFAALPFFDRDDGANQLLYGTTATSDWLDLVIYDAYGNVMEADTVADQNATPITPKMGRAAANMVDLVGSGNNAFFHAFYGQGNSYMAYTWNASGNGDPGTYVRTIATIDVNGETDPQGILGNFPVATREQSGAALRTVSGIFDVPDNNSPATKRGTSAYAPYWIAGNEFTTLLGSPTFVVDVVRDVDAYYLDAAGVTQGPNYNINDRVMSGSNFMPRCVDEFTWTRSQFTDPDVGTDPGPSGGGSQCYQFYDQVAYDDLEYSNAESPAALVGNALYIPTLIQYRTWDTTVVPPRFWDQTQQIIISRYDLPFSINCAMSSSARG